ncbi:hypothetical protein AB0J83_22540 [Actinoplanes sp. NPDC049596]|uniref:hypothetical protein n=1 Tax=unclassified Actinoplanes TaxID=2626549 RepID=UPI0034223337
MSVVAPSSMTDTPGGGVAWCAAAAVTTVILVVAGVRVVSRVRGAPGSGWGALVPVLPGFAAGGVALLVALPGMVAGEGFGYFAALGFLAPWSLGVGATGWLRGRVAMGALIAVVASGVVFLAVALGVELHVHLSVEPPD